MLDLSHSDVAKAANVSTRTLARLETGSSTVSFKKLSDIRGYFEGLESASSHQMRRWTGALRSDSNLPMPEEPGLPNSIYDPLPGLVFKAARVAASLTQEEIAARRPWPHDGAPPRKKNDVTASPKRAYTLQKKFEDDGFRFVIPDGSEGWRIFVRRANDKR
ncbi:hypothetical protein ACC676_25780 [Rhizobium ruizarguesonis]